MTYHLTMTEQDWRSLKVESCGARRREYQAVKHSLRCLEYQRDVEIDFNGDRSPRVKGYDLAIKMQRDRLERIVRDYRAHLRGHREIDRQRRAARLMARTGRELGRILAGTR